MRTFTILVLLCLAGPLTAADAVVEVFEGVEIGRKPGPPDKVEPTGYVLRHRGQTVERSVALPPPPPDLSQARRVTVTVRVEPIFSTVDGAHRPNDPWTRMGSVSVYGRMADGTWVDTELVRFITGYGGEATYEQDVTALAPLLHGTRKIRAFISTYSEEPGWRLSLRLTYADEGVGQRRPAFARYLFHDAHVTALAPRVAADVVIPGGIDPPRLRILSTGHATDGRAGNEFLSSTHILRIDGREVLRWRPWAEHGGALRRLNPWAGRRVIDGREIWSSDFDRAGWHPGEVVTPLEVPVPELSPGPHSVEVEVVGIRPEEDAAGTQGMRHHGYWAVSATVVADQPWPMP